MLRLRFDNDAIRNAIIAMEVVADRYDLAHLYVGKAAPARPSDGSEYGLICGLVGLARLFGLRMTAEGFGEVINSRDNPIAVHRSECTRRGRVTKR